MHSILIYTPLVSYKQPQITQPIRLVKALECLYILTIYVKLYCKIIYIYEFIRFIYFFCPNYYEKLSIFLIKNLLSYKKLYFIIFIITINIK